MRVGAVLVALATLVIPARTRVSAGQGGANVELDNDDIGGVVTSSRGPEAGVWVIAETSELPTKYAKIVVTDDRGRYVLPDLPNATYDIWVRGYGLVDSPKVHGAPGKHLDLTAVLAPDAKAAAQYYPANYWYALMQPPPKSDFPGTGLSGNGIPESAKTQAHWIGDAKMTFSCTQCHQLGNKFTREISPALGSFKSSVDAWAYRVQVGQSGASMASRLAPLGRQRALKIFADWTDRIAAGELPEVPPRPQGIERSVVVTLWDWADEKTFVHDEISTDKRNPTINAHGLIYGVQELSADWLVMLDPSKNLASRVMLPVAEPKPAPAWPQTMTNPSPAWGEEIIWSPRIVAHNPMMDAKGRIWTTGRDGCRLYDPATKQATIVQGCVGTHHLQFGPDDTIYSNTPTTWFKTREWEAAKDGSKAGGRFPLILDANGNGKQDPTVGPNDPPDPTKDRELKTAFLYALVPNPIDGSIWYAEMATPGALIRVAPGSNPPSTALAEYYQPPFNNPKSPVSAYLPHGIDIDTNGVVWTSLTGSGHLASFDRRKCKGPLNGPTAVSGQHCPEGWTLYQAPGPNFKGVTDPGSADSFYYNWVDQSDTLGLGKNVPLLNGSGSDSIMALVGGKFIVMRVPYPMGFHSRGMDGRIDDPKAGWKGRGLWSAYAAQATWHIEGGKGTKPKVVHFQIRPNPLAK
jgi:hypothetical protein